MRKVKTAILVATLVAVLSQVAYAKECTKMEAYAAEAVTDYLDSWENCHRAFKNYGHCDDGAIAGGFDEAISLLWAYQWQKLPEMLKYTKESEEFRAFINKRIWTEAIPEDRWQKILKKAETQCPEGVEEFCAEIIQAGKEPPKTSVEQAR